MKEVSCHLNKIMNRKILYLTFEDIFTHGVLQAMVLKPTIEIAMKKPYFHFEIVSFSRIVDRQSYTYKKNKLNPLPKNITITEFTKIGSKKSRGLIAIINLVFGFLLVFRKITRCNVVHIRSYAFLPLIILSKILKKKVIWDPRGVLSLEIEDLEGSKSFSSYILHQIEKIGLKFSDQIICVSEKMKEFFSSKTKKEMIVIPNPTQITDFDPKHKTKNLMIVYSGRLLKWHSQNSILMCYKALLNIGKPFTFNLLTPDIDSATALFQEGIKDHRSLIIKSCSSKEVISFLNKAHIGICIIEPSESKKYCAPVKFAEYLAAELLILSNKNIGDIPEYINESGNGYLLETLDYKSIKIGLNELIGKFENSYEFNKVGRNKYAWEWNINTLISMYK